MGRKDRTKAMRGGTGRIGGCACVCVRIQWTGIHMDAVYYTAPQKIQEAPLL